MRTGIELQMEKGQKTKRGLSRNEYGKIDNKKERGKVIWVFCFARVPIVIKRRQLYETEYILT